MTNNNLYVSLEEVKQVLKAYEHLDITSWAIDEDIDTLPTIDLWKIDTMIEEIHKKAEDIDPDTNRNWEEELDKLHWKKIWLQELKSILFPKQ